MSDWDEIRRLAADLQRAQLAGTTQKLSERNCIEIVMKLIDLNLIDVVYSTDGKEYITPQHLIKEVKDELYVAGGRISIVELASLLSVDFTHAENAAQQVVKSERDTHLILGQLVSRRYLDGIAGDVNERLQQKGIISIPSLTKEYDLPADFLVEQLVNRLGSIIEGFRDESDPKVIMTTGHVARNRAKIRGALSAITKPTTVSSLVNRFGFQERLFFSIAEELIRTGVLPGTLSGGRTVSKASYIPHCHARAQHAWIDNFYASNGYLELDAISRLGISDPLQYVKKKFQETNEKVIYLDSCVLGPQVISQLESAVEEALGTGAWVDILPILPSILSEEDTDQLIQSVLKQKDGQFIRLASTVIVSPRIVDSIRSGLEPLMKAKAAKDVESGAVAQAIVDSSAKGASQGHMDDMDDDKLDKKEERRKKAAGGKAGGGAQGRETKTKSTKKKGGNKRKGHADDDWDDSDDEAGNRGGRHAGKSGDTGKGKSGASGKGGSGKKELVFKTQDELEEFISSTAGLADCPEEVFNELASLLKDSLDKQYRQMAKEQYEASLAASLQNKRRSHADLQEKVNSLHSTFRMCEKALHVFQQEEHVISLSKHLLKTCGQELLSEVFLYLAEENMIKVAAETEITQDQRVKIIAELPKDLAEIGRKLNKAVSGNSAEDFIKLFEDECMNLCDIMLKKPDKKKERQVIFSHRHQLQDQLSSCADPALTLHLAVLLIFQHFTGCMLQASGKFVPIIISHLQEHLSDDQRDVLSNHQQLVVGQLTNGEDGEDAEAKLHESSAAVKSLVTGLKKSFAD